MREGTLTLRLVFVDWKLETAVSIGAKRSREKNRNEGYQGDKQDKHFY